VLDGLAYDGASNLPALVATEGNDLALLFTDGLSNWGPTNTLAPSPVPLYAVSAAASVDATRLRQLAERSGGEWLDLASTPTPKPPRPCRPARRACCAWAATRDAISSPRHPMPATAISPWLAC
jgi:hypothetical protein